MIPVLYKRRANGLRRIISQLAEKPREWKEFVTHEHSVERWYA
ncbi:hypothetical protein HOR13_gp48 [Xanthomonas phage XAJ24]|uniref:Uncharacterized protein n=1 Tax=Xanthomonas phage XAJ24 TaxID=1775250 RepID=A0A1I9L285_9CAUD|nr:hypothetical protein HOR13_gp48 [Xanthomonas phage XAJ24]AMW36072.1 hypothetical protein [Xanthomonas phage XAJ24]